MLDSTFELISLAASNSLMVFCFFNLIIAILLVGSSKPNSQLNDQKPKLNPSIVNDDNINRNSVSWCENVSSTLVEAGEVSSVSITMTDSDNGIPDDDEEEKEKEEDDDDLKRRVEEFIEKINKGWRAEKVKTWESSSSSGQ